MTQHHLAGSARQCGAATLDGAPCQNLVTEGNDTWCAAGHVVTAGPSMSVGGARLGTTDAGAAFELDDLVSGDEVVDVHTWPQEERYLFEFLAQGYRDRLAQDHGRAIDAGVDGPERGVELRAIGDVVHTQAWDSGLVAKLLTTEHRRATKALVSAERLAPLSDLARRRAARLRNELATLCASLERLR